MRHLFCVLACALVASAASGREWTDVSGKHHCEATLLRCTGGQVWLLRSDDRPIVIDMKKLSAVDRQYLASPEALEQSVPLGGVQPVGQGHHSPLMLRRAHHTVFKTADLNWLTTFSVRPASAQETLPPPAAEDLGDANKPPVRKKHWHKKVLSGKCGTFHLPSSWGTALYWLGQCPCRHYLSNLEFHHIEVPTTSKPGYAVFANLEGTGGVHYWAFAMNPEFCGMFAVYLSDGGPYRFYQWSNRELPE